MASPHPGHPETAGGHAFPNGPAHVRVLRLEALDAT